MFIVNDSGSFSARVQPEYAQDNPIDTTLGDVLATLKWASSLNREGNPVDYYALTLNGVVPGEQCQIVLRYMIPNSADAIPKYPLNILFDSESSNPGVIEFSFSSDAAGQSPYILSINDLNYQLSDGQYLQIPYQSSFRVQVTDTVCSRMHVTSIDSGSWQGKYLLLNTSVPDSVIARLSKPLELVVLWRWNRPNSFVIKKESGDKWLTGYGHQAISQAAAVKTLFDEVTTTGNKAGMVHSIQYTEPEQFALCAKNSSAYAKLDNYLGQFTREYFLNSGYFEYDTRPTNPDDTIPGTIDSSRTEFLESMKLVHGLYSNGSGIMRHLVIVSSGPVQISRNLVTIEELDTLFDDVSVDCEDAVWRDVNFSLVKHVSAQKTLTPFAGFDLPEFRPHSFLLELASESKSYSFPLSSDQASFSVMAKSRSAWDPTLIWNGYTASGSLIDSVHSRPLVYECPEDTGLVKLWAANSDRISETRESNIGIKYGVVSETSSLKIYPSYKGYDSTATAFAPIATTHAQKTGVTISKKTAVRGFSCHKAGSMIRIMLPGDAQIEKVKIYSLSGRLLAKVDPSTFRMETGYSIPISSLSRMLTSQVVVMRVHGKKGIWSQTLVL